MAFSLPAPHAALDARAWPLSVWVVIASLLVLGLRQLAARPAFPRKAPPVAPSYPVVGALRFFSHRGEYMTELARRSRSGHFAFHFGKHQIVGVSGDEGRRAFFDSKELNLAAGYGTLFHAAPEVRSRPSDTDERFDDDAFKKHFVRIMKREKFEANLAQMVADCRTALERFAARDLPVVDVFEDLWALVYQLTLRTVVCNEIANDPVLMRRTLNMFEDMDKATGAPWRVIFPWLPTASHLRRVWAGTQMYMVMSGIVDTRRKEGRREEDALQALIDGGADMVEIVSQVIGSLFAGLVNSGINAGWLLCYLTQNPEWYGRIQREVDASIAKHRASPDESPFDIFARLTLDDWETDFPLIDLALRETIRFTVTGCALRRNTSGREVPIGKSGEVIPVNAFAVYFLDDAMMDPDIYPDPFAWNPSRFLPEHAEDVKPAAHGYLGWGSGRHPCLGMRFAKLETYLMTATFVASFDFTLCDKNGKETTTLSPIDRNRHSASKPDPTMYLRYKSRS